MAVDQFGNELTEEEPRRGNRLFRNGCLDITR